MLSTSLGFLLPRCWPTVISGPLVTSCRHFNHISWMPTSVGSRVTFWWLTLCNSYLVVKAKAFTQHSYLRLELVPSKEKQWSGQRLVPLNMGSFTNRHCSVSLLKTLILSTVTSTLDYNLSLLQFLWRGRLMKMWRASDKTLTAICSTRKQPPDRSELCTRRISPERACFAGPPSTARAVGRNSQNAAAGSGASDSDVVQEKLFW